MKARGYTPLYDEMIERVGLTAAAVWGRMWRYAQQEDRVCSANQTKIANNLGLSRMTIYRAIQDLMDAGYLEDTTPDLRNVPHSYRVIDRHGVAWKITDPEPAPEPKNVEDKKPEITPGQTEFLEAFGAKRFKTKAQYELVTRLEKQYPTNLSAYIQWAAVKGMSLSQAVGAAEKALSKWGGNTNTTAKGKPGITKIDPITGKPIP